MFTTSNLHQKDSKQQFNDEGKIISTDDKQALVNETKIAPDYKVRFGGMAISPEGQMKTTMNVEGDMVYQPKVGLKFTPSLKLPVSYEVIVGAEGEYSKGKNEKDGFFASPGVKLSWGGHEFKANATVTGIFVPRSEEEISRLKERDHRRHKVMEKYSTSHSFE